MHPWGTNPSGQFRLTLPLFNSLVVLTVTFAFTLRVVQFSVAFFEELLPLGSTLPTDLTENPNFASEMWHDAKSTFSGITAHPPRNDHKSQMLSSSQDGRTANFLTPSYLESFRERPWPFVG